ncbi:MAG: asparagine synthase [Methylococcales bacterium]|nr:asparagine synthase [Methylococcales bacterium]
MTNSKHQSFFRQSPEGRMLTREAYSVSPLYFFNQPIPTAAGNKWLVSHSLRELGFYVNYRPSPEGIRDFLCYGFVPAPRTIFQGISAVPSGMSCQLPFANEDISWHVADTPAIRPSPQQPESTFLQQLSAHTAIAKAAVLLSGGLDSAMIAAAAHAAGTPITAYHARFSGADTSAGSDTHAARMTVQHLGIAHKEIVINSLDALRWFGRVVDALDQPLGDPVLLPFYCLFKKIYQHQPQHTVLTGEGGDQLFGSWSMKPMLMRELYPEAGYRQEQGYLASFHKFADEWDALISAKLGQQLDNTVELESPIKQAFASSPSADFCNQLRWVDLQLKGLQHIVPRIDAMAKAHQLTLHHPFFQTDMIELGIALPNHLKLSGATDKVLLKMLARSYLPEQVVDRRKQGMGVPTSQWFRLGLRPLAMYWLNKNRVAKSGLLNPDTVQAIRQQTLTSSDGRGRRWGDRLWMLCVLECWFASLEGK